MPQAPGFQRWPPCLESCSFGALPQRRWAPTNPGSIAAATEIRRASGVAGTTIANLPVRSRLPGRVGSSAARNSSRSTRPRQVRTERTGSAAGPITHAVVYSDRHPARSATALRQGQTKFQQDFHKSTVAGVDHRGPSLRKVPRGQRGVPEDPCGKEPRNLVCANLPTPCRLAISRCIKHNCALGNSRATIRGASCSGDAAPQQT